MRFAAYWAIPNGRGAALPTVLVFDRHRWRKLHLFATTGVQGARAMDFSQAAQEIAESGL